jgi:hypothetical protein
MTRIVIVGEMFYSDLQIGGGPMPGGGQPSHPIAGVPPGYWGGVAPPYPDQGLPGWQPRPSHPIAPGGRPPGIWGGPPLYPDQGLPGAPPGYWGGSSPHPDQGLPPLQPPAGGTEVPPEEYTPAPPPEHISSQYIVSVYDPKTMQWTTKSYPPPPAG